MKIYDIVLLILSFAVSSGLYAAVIAERKIKYQWLRLLYFIPLFLIWIFLGISGADRDLIPVYAGSLLAAAGFFIRNEKLRKILCTVSGIMVPVSLALCLADPGYRIPSFTDDFEVGFKVLREQYCLTEHKEVDFDDLYERYYPKIEQAEKEYSRELNYIAWHEMLCELYDGHTGYAVDNEVTEAAENIMFGNDFGFSMMTLSDGRNVAVNIENGSEAQLNGIENGTEILSLNGKSVEECKSEVKYFERIIPDAESEEFYRACYAAGQSGDSMSVDFIDDIGNERTVILNKTGFYRERLKNTIEKVNGGRNIATLSFEELSDTSVLYRIKGMAYDTKSYLDNDYSQLESEFRNSLQSYKDRGFTKLIIDLRDNGGGSPVMIKSLAEIIASEGQHEYAGFGVIDEKTGEYLRDENTGRYLSGGVCSFSGEDLWNHGEIIILVNAYCISAGDHFVNMMYGQDNVRITGFTKSNGSGQGTGSCYLKNGAFSFSKVPTMDAGGEIYIDCGADRKTGVKINEIIPFTEDAVRAVFDRGEDYVLECVK